MPTYGTDNPLYYSKPKKYSTVSNILGASLRSATAEDEAAALQSKENLRAFLLSRMPSKADSPAELKKLVEMFPKLKADPAKREERRILSEQARNALAEIGARLHFAWKGISGLEREHFVLFKRFDDKVSIAETKRREQIVRTGTAKEKGELLEAHVREKLAMFNDVVKNGITDQEVIANLEKYHELQDLTSNAEKLLAQVEKGNYEVSPETVEILKIMERHAPKIDLSLQRVRMIAEANYEHINVPYLTELTAKENAKYSEYVGEFLDDLDELEKITATMAQRDLAEILPIVRHEKGCVRKVNLMERIEKDFLPTKDSVRLKFVGQNNKIFDAPFTFGSQDKTVESNLYSGYILATDSDGDAACYQVDVHGEVTKAFAEDILTDLAPEIDDALQSVHLANKGLFIGSSEYTNAMKALEQLATSIQAFGAQPDQNKVEAMKNQLASVKELCDTYKGTKDPENFKNEREKIRYEAMDKALNVCERQMSCIDLYNEAKLAELNAALRGRRANKSEIPIIPTIDAFQRANDDYSDALSKNIIPNSDVGGVADELRASIIKNLNDMLNIKKFDPDVARHTFGNMVALEMVKMGRTVDENNNIIAGPFERALADMPGPTVQSIRNNSYFKAVTENLTGDMIRYFVMSDGAKMVAGKMLKIAQQQAPANEAANQPEVHKEINPANIIANG